jgi:hypothetical protein
LFELITISAYVLRDACPPGTAFVPDRGSVVEHLFLLKVIAEGLSEAKQRLNVRGVVIFVLNTALGVVMQRLLIGDGTITRNKCGFAALRNIE